MAAVDLSTELGGVAFPNPVFTASGCAAAGQELDRFFDVTQLGAVVTKSIMLEPRSGRATPRMAETPSGMLNSIGLQGPGIDVFLDKDLAWLQDKGARAVVSIAGGSVEDYAELVLEQQVPEREVVKQAASAAAPLTEYRTAAAGDVRAALRSVAHHLSLELS